MQYLISDEAEGDFNKMDFQLQNFFLKHFEKLEKIPPRRHLKHGVPYYVESVTKQARFVYKIEADFYVTLRCFKTHKEYERWLKSFI